MISRLLSNSVFTQVVGSPLLARIRSNLLKQRPVRTDTRSDDGETCLGSALNEDIRSCMCVVYLFGNTREVCGLDDPSGISEYTNYS